MKYLDKLLKTHGTITLHKEGVKYQLRNTDRVLLEASSLIELMMKADTTPLQELDATAPATRLRGFAYKPINETTVGQCSLGDVGVLLWRMVRGFGKQSAIAKEIKRSRDYYRRDVGHQIKVGRQRVKELSKI